MASTAYYLPDPEQIALGEAFYETIAGLMPLDRLRETRTETAQTMAGLAESGLFALTRSFDAGGSDLSAAEEALILHGVGKQVPSPSIVAAVAVNHVASDATGSVAFAYHQGEQIVLVDGDDAAYVLLRTADGVALHERGSSNAPLLDDQLWLSRLSAPSQLGPKLAEASATQLLRLRLVDAAILAGLAEGALDGAVAYAKVREQFGRPIGSFQAVKHHLANMAIWARAARDQVSFAAVAVDQGRADAALQVESALLVAGNAALDNAGKNIQIHGGMGFSDEADPHLYLKRARLFIAIAGGLEATTERLAGIAPVV